ncbi:hypothetical protein K491DRAFT_776954 [Lophiostoma macrostomum CBS 122681]|uniref:Uncharacterized protein n=1 Tax=Lophiostoma macrostomum CBS 122681 TaxID=1314788 RepID=A0A6A6TE79_9PLEO|nr:hypothetical protein K491DRAFT_776954 [Lophiostoma macrostomum CBS 122681]
MKSTTLLTLLWTAALSFAAPDSSLNSTGASSLTPIQNLPFLKGREMPAQPPGNFKDCASNEMHYPALDEYFRALEKACITMIPSSYYFVQYGYKRTTVDVAVYDWPTTVGMSFELWQYHDQQPDQTLSQQQCMDGFYKADDSGIDGCRVTNDGGGGELLVKGYRFDKASDGFETVSFQATILG